jgi:adenosine kinase
MMQHASDFHAAGIPFIFDPGQGMPMFNGEELLHFIELADYVTLNDYEAELMQERTGKRLEELAQRVNALIVTLGAKGSVIYSEDKQIAIPCVNADNIIDPTGCGDAYRSGLLYGISHGWDWENTGRLAAFMGALKIGSRGAQNHTIGREELADRLRRDFGITLSA